MVKTFTRRISNANDLSITSFNQTRKVTLTLSMLVHVQWIGVGCQEMELCHVFVCSRPKHDGKKEDKNNLQLRSSLEC